MTQISFQDQYPDIFAHCYGCGRLNEHGYQIKSYWDGDESVCHFQPKSYHTAIPGYVYGGLLASLIDCHGPGTAAAAGYRAEGYTKFQLKVGGDPDTCSRVVEAWAKDRDHALQLAEKLGARK